MKTLLQLGSLLLLFAFLNLILLLEILPWGLVPELILSGLLSGFFVAYLIYPFVPRLQERRMTVLSGGVRLLYSALLLGFFEICGLLWTVLFWKPDVTLPHLVIHFVVAAAALGVMLLDGFLRVMILSKQVGILLRVVTFLTLWIPLVNLFVTLHCCRIARHEVQFETAKSERNQKRKENEICKTKYPILLVHGIFWRDWQFFNYWGRIPGELTRNGATVYYGNHQSAAPMEDGARELAEQVKKILETENCQKVNIIAHSKGGLDARYMISRLDMAGSVASLTTIGTPHTGSVLVERLLNRTPAGVVKMLNKRYNALFKKLGDRNPDFLSGVQDLTLEKCAEFNQTVPNVKGVVYQSMSAKMRSFRSASFPLNLGYLLIRRGEGENDGFVGVASARWGKDLGCYAAERTRGVSHGDMIDLTRKNIRGFDVCECYVKLVSGLKKKGL